MNEELLAVGGYWGKRQSVFPVVEFRAGHPGWWVIKLHYIYA